MPKVSFASALPVGTESLHEIMELELYEKVSTERFKERINMQLPDGLKVNDVQDISSEKRGLKLLESHFRITLNGPGINMSLLDNFLSSDYFPVLKQTKKGMKEVNARPLVKSIDCISTDSLELTVKHVSGPEIKPANLIKEIFQMKDEEAAGIKILKTKQLLD